MLAELNLLGQFRLRPSDGSDIDLPSHKDRALLAILALRPGVLQSRDKLAGLLWSDRGEAQARDSLKHALMHIRQSLAQVASRLGYESEAAFSRAFKRIVGIPPGSLRRH